MSWMKQAKPAKAPPIPPHVDVMQVQELISRFEASGQLLPQVAYLQSQLPEIPMDRWGQPLPLSVARQERFDRMMAVFTQPMERVTALLHAGSLDTIEANAIRFGHPEVYARLRDLVTAEMGDAGPPLPQWSEACLGILFGRDAAHVYVDDQQGEKPNAVREFAGKPPLPTPADMTSESALRSQH